MFNKEKTKDLEKYLIRYFEKFMKKNAYLNIYLLLAYTSANAYLPEVRWESEHSKSKGKDQ